MLKSLEISKNLLTFSPNHILCVLNPLNQNEDEIETADYHWRKALDLTDYSYPKYLAEYAEFVWRQKGDFAAAEHYVTKALGLHPTNALYHQLYTKLLRALIEDQGEVLCDSLSF